MYVAIVYRRSAGPPKAITNNKTKQYVTHAHMFHRLGKFYHVLRRLR